MPSLLPPIHSYSRHGIGPRLVNCYAEQSPESDKSPVRLIGAPGITPLSTVGTDVRGLLTVDNLLYIVSGTKLYKMDTNNVVTELGDIGGGGAVVMVADRSDVVVLSSGSAYVWNGTTVAQVTDPDFRTASDMEFLDNFILFVEADSDRFFAAEIGDATSYDALDFATAESSPDKLVGMIVDHRQIILAGQKTIEIWWNAGAAGFPFERIPNGALEIGCAAGKSLAKADNSVFWLDDSRIVRRLSDLTPIRVSQHGVEEAISKYATVSDARAFTYTDQGHIFYVLTFPTQGATWLYDITTGEWSERETLGYDYWRVSHYAYFNDQHIVSETDSGRLGVMSSNTYSEFGGDMVMEWWYAPIYADGKNLRHAKFQLVTRAGKADSSQVGLSYSDDDGQTFTAMPLRNMGATGEYWARTQWHRLGASRARVYKCFISDPVERYIQDTQVTVSG